MIGKPTTTKAKRFGARKQREGDKAPNPSAGFPIDDPMIEEVRKKSKAQALRDEVAAGARFDAHDVDVEEGRSVKDSKGRTTTDTNPKTRKKRRGKTKAKMGGGKIYASQNKKYGGGIYPKMGK